MISFNDYQMEETPNNTIKFVLATYEDGRNNHYYDSTFNLRVPFRPNRNGVYRLEMNEVFFKNDEPTLRKNIDYYEIQIHMNDGATHKIRYTVTKDIYSYESNENYKKLLDVMRGKYFNSENDKIENATAQNSCLRRTPIDQLNGKFNAKIELYGSEDGTFTGKDEDNPYSTDTGFKTCMRMKISISEQGTHNNSTPNLANVKSIGLVYSSNFCYLFNSLRAEYIGEPTTATANYRAANFDFYNLRVCGAYIYIADTNINSDVKTYNTNNQAYNIVAYSYNYSSVHNSPIQCNSTMTGTIADLSNFRVRILNDQWELVPLLEPVSILMTVSNTD